MEIIALRAAGASFDEVGRYGDARTAKLCLQPEAFRRRKLRGCTIELYDKRVGELKCFELVGVSAHAADIGQRPRRLLAEVRGPKPEAQREFK